MKGFKLADDLSVDLVAAEPLLANPVAFDIDEKGNFYVVESFRLHKGVTDIRQHMNWLDEELASQSVEDMRKMFHRHKVKGLTDYSDRVRCWSTRTMTVSLTRPRFLPTASMVR